MANQTLSELLTEARAYLGHPAAEELAKEKLDLAIIKAREQEETIRKLARQVPA